MCFHTHKGDQPQYKRLFYRTVPMKYTKQHRPPWIGKGYIKVKDNVGTPAIAGWDGDGLDYEKLTVKIADDTQSVSIEADYVIQS